MCHLLPTLPTTSGTCCSCLNELNERWSFLGHSDEGQGGAGIGTQARTVPSLEYDQGRLMNILVDLAFIFYSLGRAGYRNCGECVYVDDFVYTMAVNITD